MATHNTARFLNFVKMNKDVFISFLTFLETYGQLSSSRHLTSGEKLMIYIFICSGNSMRAADERFQHSLDTIHHAFHEVKFSILYVKPHLLSPYLEGTPPDTRIIDDGKYANYFYDCIGAFDGSQIPIQVTPDLKARCRNRKGFCSINAFIACNFNMTTQFILSGWEGSAHDSRVLSDAYNKGFTIHPGKYWLGDAGYALRRWILTPYRGVRYHLKEWAAAPMRPANKEELFNLRHAALRNVIERLLGVAKKRFKILNNVSSFDFRDQGNIIMTCLLMNNYIRLNSLYEDAFYIEYDNEMNALPLPPLIDDAIGGIDGMDANDVDAADMIIYRDALAQQMWNDYQIYLHDNVL
jgi:hypothetical protein